MRRARSAFRKYPTEAASIQPPCSTIKSIIAWSGGLTGGDPPLYAAAVGEPDANTGTFGSAPCASSTLAMSIRPVLTASSSRPPAEKV